MGPSVYRFKGVVYDRVADVDVRLKGDDQISAMYIRKQNLYTEQRIYRMSQRTISTCPSSTVREA